MSSEPLIFYQWFLFRFEEGQFHRRFPSMGVLWSSEQLSPLRMIRNAILLTNGSQFKTAGLRNSPNQSLQVQMILPRNHASRGILLEINLEHIGKLKQNNFYSFRSKCNQFQKEQAEEWLRRWASERKTQALGLRENLRKLIVYRPVVSTS